MFFWLSNRTAAHFGYDVCPRLKNLFTKKKREKTWPSRNWHDQSPPSHTHTHKHYWLFLKGGKLRAVRGFLWHLLSGRDVVAPDVLCASYLGRPMRPESSAMLWRELSACVPKHETQGSGNDLMRPRRPAHSVKCQGAEDEKVAPFSWTLLDEKLNRICGFRCNDRILHMLGEQMKKIVQTHEMLR